MDDTTRRNFLIAAGVGAAATAGVVAAVTTDREPAAATAGAAPATTATGALVAYVQDARSGRIAVMAGETEVVVHDPDLVARLAAHATRKQV